jgi:hypothetical protein
LTDLPVTDKMKRRPCYDRALRRRHLMPLNPPTEAEKQDAILILRDSWLWADEITEEAFRIFEEAGH